jgi:hypothetical protein
VVISNRLAWLAAFALFSAPAGVLAQGRPIGLSDHTGGRDHALELELDASIVGEDGPGEGQHTTLLPKVYGSFGLSDDLELEVEIPSVFYDYSPDNDDGVADGNSTLLIGNPSLALFYADRSPRSFARIGGGIALPLLDVDDFTDVGAVIAAAATRGLMDLWLYLPDRLSLIVPAQVQMRASSIVLGADGALALLIPTGDNDEAEAELMLQLGGLIGVALGDATLGMRVQVATMLTEDDGDNTQASLMPFIQADLDGGAFVHGGVLLNLDAPYGVLGDDGADVWALRIGGGARF